MNPVSEEVLRYSWFARQGLDGKLSGASPGNILSRTGWARSVGGANPYLTLFARGGCSREIADAAVAAGEIQELPSARGCTYVLPASDFALGLQVAAPFGNSEMAVARKLGVTDAEIDRLCAAVVEILDATDVSLEPDRIRQLVGDVTRSLGEEGKKKGLTTTLPLALEKLQLAGKIRRVPSNGRLDQQRYRYARWRLTLPRLSPDEVNVELARRFFHWIGPATLAEFQRFSGLGVKQTKAAVEGLGLTPVHQDRLLLPEDVDAFAATEVPKQPVYALVSSLDWIVSTSLGDRESHPILDRGAIIGRWEYDPAGAGSIVWAVEGKSTPAVREAVRCTEEWVRAQLGDVRSFSLDSPKSRAPRIASIRESAAASGRE